MDKAMISILERMRTLFYVLDPTEAQTTLINAIVDEAIAAWNTRAPHEPVAPPSPDIAGLVDRANEEAAYIDSARGYTGPLSTPTTLRDLATALQCVAQERDAANANLEACEFSLETAEERIKADWAKHGGMEIAKGQWQARAEAAEARIATARDEGREEVAEWLHQNGHITLAAGIRALKNNKI